MNELILVYEIHNEKKIFRIQGDLTKIDIFESIHRINYSYTYPTKIFIKIDDYKSYHDIDTPIVHPVIRYVMKQYQELLTKYNIPSNYNFVDNIFISEPKELINEDIKSIADVYGSILSKLNRIIDEESTKLNIKNEPTVYRLISGLLIPDHDYSRLIGYMMASSNKKLIGKINEHEITNFSGSFTAQPIKFEQIKTKNKELISILKYCRFESQDLLILDSPRIKLWTKGWLYNSRII